MAFIIVAASLFLNFLVPYSYFLYVTRVRGESFAPLRAIDSYLSGMVGDTLFVPLINLFLFKSVYGLPVSLNVFLLLLAFAMGFFTMSVSHALQAVYGPVNWSMPTPWRWSFPGKYHMFSATLQYAYMSLMLVFIFKERAVILSDISRLYFFTAATISVVIFLVIYAYDYRKKE